MAEQNESTTTMEPPVKENANGARPLALASPQEPVVHAATVKRMRKRWVVVAVLIVVLIAGIVVGVPRVIYVWNHVSTDDATVNSHVTYVSPRVAGTVTAVLVDDNQYVEVGTPLVRLDSKPYQLDLDQARSAVDRAKLMISQQIATLNVAEAQLNQTRTGVRAAIGKLRANWYLMASVQDFVRYGTALLRANVATLKEKEASLKLAQEQYDRIAHMSDKAVSQEEIDQRRSELDVAKAQLESQEETVQQSRAFLGLPADMNDPGNVPDTLGQTFNGTQFAVASFQESLASLGVQFDIFSPRLTDLRDRFVTMQEEETVENSPQVKTAEAQVNAARAALGTGFDPAHPELHPLVVEAQKKMEQAELQVGYTDVRAPIAGYISRRSVNPGAVVGAGQSLMAIRPLKDVWIDANFKETQLADLRIGQPVEIYVDAYPDKVFHGRVAGFSPGTGAVMSLLPPENATGNFVKVVQRLPVKVELTEENPTDTPLFAGLSVTPEVDIRSEPSGPDAGKRLLSAATGAAEPVPMAGTPTPTVATGRDQHP